MAVPPIELEWGGARWPRGQRRRVRPYVEMSLGLAADGMDFLGIAPASRKRATVWGVYNHWDRAGEARDADNFDIYIKEEYIKRSRKLSKLAIPLAFTSLHEVIHCVREEAGYHVDMIERAVGEGLSIWAEILLGRELLNKRELRAFENSRLVTEDMIDQQAMWAAFIADASYEDSFSDQDPYCQAVEEIHDAWFSAVPGDMPAGNKLGVIAVGHLINVGARISELIHLPPEDIMGYQS